MYYIARTLRAKGDHPNFKWLSYPIRSLFDISFLDSVHFTLTVNKKVAGQNGDKPKRRQTKTATDQNGDSWYQNGDRKYARQVKKATEKKGISSKRRQIFVGKTATDIWWPKRRQIFIGRNGDM
jgi:hypothetical protein